MLGHEVDFGYCRQGSGVLPCRKVFDCWFETFAVEDFIGAHYSEDQIQQILAPAKPKLTTILELIQQAQQNAKPDEPQ